MIAKRRTPTPPTPEAVAAEIAKLREMKPYVRARTGFGDDNHEAIDAQIEVLEKRLTDSAIYDRFQPIDDESGEPDESGAGAHALDNALEARRWLEGEEKDAPSVGWSELDRRKG